MLINTNAIPSALPDLSFPMVQYGLRETPWSLLPLLYVGGSASDTREALESINGGLLGEPRMERFTLVERLHQELSDDLANGGSRHTAKTRINHLRIFFAHADNVNADLRLETVSQTFLSWADALLHRQLVAKDVSETTVYGHASNLSGLFGRVLGRKFPLIKETRIRKPRESGKFGTSAPDKVNLTETFKFGRFLLDVCAGLSPATTKGPLPVTLVFPDSKQVELWSGLKNPATRSRKTRKHNHEARTSEEKRSAWEADGTLKTRYPLVNLRIEAELLFFIAQTGMNLQQAYTLQMTSFHYTSHLDGYQVRQHKARREGAVLFEIFSEYRTHFEEYLEWRNAWFPDLPEGLLFPFVTAGRNLSKAPEFQQVRKLCTDFGIPFTGPRKLRKTRINWLLRKMSEPQQVADMAQHDLKTLLRQYAEPNPQLAMVEISKFHTHQAESIIPPGPGLCETQRPESMIGSPSEAPVPDCVSSAGCLFCKNNRDVDSPDHIWSLVSFRHLKSIELARYKPPKTRKLPEHPAQAVVDRITQKVRFFEGSSEVRRMWVEESLLRIEEGDYHPAWDGFIQLNEMMGTSE